MKDFVGNNPALTYSFIIGLVAAIIAVVVAAGVPLSVELTAAIEGLVVMIAAILIGVVTRGKVVPFKNVLEYRTLNSDGSTSAHVTSGPANEMIVPGQEVRPYSYGSSENTQH